MVSQENIQINLELGRARGAMNLLAVVNQHLRKFNMVNASTALQRLAKSAGNKNADTEDAEGFSNSLNNRIKRDPRFTALLEKTTKLAALDPSTYQPRHLSTTLWACATLDVQDSGLEKVILTACDHKLHDFKSQEISNLIWAVARLGGKSGTWTIWRAFLQRLLPIAHPILWDFTPQGLSNVAWGLATMNVDNRDFMHALVAMAAKTVHTFKPLELANTVWAMAKLQLLTRLSDTTDASSTTSQAWRPGLPSKHAPELVGAIQRNMSDFTARNFASIAWAVGKLVSDGADPSVWDFFRLVVPNVHTFVSNMNGIELAMVCWALATATEDKGEGDTNAAAATTALQTVITSVSPRIDSLSGRQLATLVWSVAKLRVSDTQLLQRVADCACPRVSQLNPQDLDNLAWGFARCEHIHLALMLAIAEATTRLLSSPGDMTPGGEEEAEGAGSFPSKNLANILWAMAKLGVGKEIINPNSIGQDVWSVFAKTTCKTVRKRAGEFNPRDLANTAWALAALGETFQAVDTTIKTTKTIKALAKAARACLGNFNAQECSKLLYSMTRAGVSDSQLSQLAAQTRTVDYHFPAMDQTVVLEQILGGGRHLTDTRELTGATGATGGALWDASYVLAEWLSRAQVGMIGGGEGALGDLASVLRSGWAEMEGKVGVELGAGLGLTSIVAALRGVTMVATDGDDAVLSLMQTNVYKNVPCSTSSVHKLRVEKLLWGQKEPLQSLNLPSPPDYILGSGIIYGSDKGVFKVCVRARVSIHTFSSIEKHRDRRIYTPARTDGHARLTKRVQWWRSLFIYLSFHCFPLSPFCERLRSWQGRIR